ncbi:hypothetical protein FRB94_011984 [Tulasnella sp. JGI-2019a]|nr:hypothetical protein FRB94_011984 [Tulasnella sp. JGI-2019a]
MGQTASRNAASPDAQRNSVVGPSSSATETTVVAGPNGNHTVTAEGPNINPRLPARRRVSTLLKKITRRSTIDVIPEAPSSGGGGNNEISGRLNGDHDVRAGTSATPRPRTASAADPATDFMRRRSRNIKDLFRPSSWAPGSDEVPAIAPYPAPPREEKKAEVQPPDNTAASSSTRSDDIKPTASAAIPSPLSKLPSAVSSPTASQPSLASGSSSAVSSPASLSRRPTLSSLPDVPSGGATFSTAEITAQREMAMDHLAAERAAIRRRIAMLSGSDEPTPSMTPITSSTSRPASTLSTTTSPSSLATPVALEEDPATGSTAVAGCSEVGAGVEVDPTSVPDPIDLAEAAEHKAPAEPQETRPLVSENLHNAVNNEPTDSNLPTEILSRLLEAFGHDDASRAGGSRAGRASTLPSPVDTLRPPISDAHTSTANTTAAPSGAPTSTSAPPPQQPAVLPPPLPIIPAGTTMIIQGIVQAADEPSPSTEGDGANRSAQVPSTTTNGMAEIDRNRISQLLAPGTASPSSATAGMSPSRAAAMLSGTPAPEPELPLGRGVTGQGTSVSQGSDSSSSAAELLGALLTAAASATANMLLSDPPNSGNPSAGSAAALGAGAAPSFPPPAPPVAPAPSSSTTTPPNSTSQSPSSELTPRSSSVGTGPRPRPSSSYTPGSSIARDRSRPRSMIGAMRDRLMGGSTTSAYSELDAAESSPRQAIDGARPDTYTENTPATDAAIDSAIASASRDPIETLRERIANELMRALAQRDGSNGNGNGGTATPEPLSPTRPPGGGFPITTGSNFSTPVSPMLFSTDSARLLEALLPPEGSFQRFLHDTNVDLRATLNERNNLRRELRASIPLPLPSTDGDAAPAASSSAETSGQSTAPGLTSDASASSGTPTLLVNRPAEGVIEPRLNWWRMHRFPSRIVAAPANTAPRPPGSPALPTPSSTNPLSSTPNTSAAGSPPSLGVPNSMVLVPVIVVGIRTAPTVLMQDIAAMTNPQTGNTNQATSPTSPVFPSSSPPWANDTSIPSSLGGADQENRTWPGRAADIVGRAITRRRLDRERERDTIRQRIADLEARIGRLGRAVGGLTAEVDHATNAVPTATAENATGAPEPREGTRNYLIWVIGGYYPETHPILVSPNLLLNHFDQDDFWGLADLLGQVKPPVASKEDIDRAGLQIIKAELLKQYESEGKVTSNTTDRCLICLSDYEADEDLRIMSCKHVFHQGCVDKWLEVGRNNCPACRTKGVEVMDVSMPSSSSNGDIGGVST